MSVYTLTTGMAAALLMLAGTATAGEKMMMSDEDEMESVTFESLDTNGDGYISASESEDYKALNANWERADANQDGQLDVSEFSAFEHEGQMTPPQESEIGEVGAAPYHRTQEETPEE